MCKNIERLLRLDMFLYLILQYVLFVVVVFSFI